jgi:hypothetical protein
MSLEDFIEMADGLTYAEFCLALQSLHAQS